MTDELPENTSLWLLSRMKMTDGLASELEPEESESGGGFLGRALYEEVLSPRLLYPDSVTRFIPYSGDASPVEVESGTHSFGVWSVSWSRPLTSVHDDTSEEDTRPEEGRGLVVEVGSSVSGRGGSSGGLSSSILTVTTFPVLPPATDDESVGEGSSPGSTERGLTCFPSSRGMGKGSCALLFSSEMKFPAFVSTGGAGKAFLASRLWFPFSLL